MIHIQAVGGSSLRTDNFCFFLFPPFFRMFVFKHYILSLQIFQK